MNDRPRHTTKLVAALLLGMSLPALPLAIEAEVAGSQPGAAPVRTAMAAPAVIAAVEAPACGDEVDLALAEVSGFETPSELPILPQAHPRPGGGQCTPWGRRCRAGSSECCSGLRCAFDGYIAWCRY
jgi:hypothetical protein